MTEAERNPWEHLRLRKISGFKFRRQYEVAPYIVDFICVEESLVIEIDGGQHSGAVEYDSARTEFLKKTGYRVLRFWNNDVLQNADGVVQLISEALRGDGPPSRPSPSGRGKGQIKRTTKNREQV
jgi:very-short-patch-repair endonuclease